MIMDIDRFKYINDLFGSEVGDEVLQRISETLRATVGTGDIVARLGSDEFGVIHRYGAHLIDTASIAEHIRRAIAQKVMIGGQDIVMTVTIGIALFPDNGKDAKTLLKNADMALSRAKSQGRNTVQFYSTDIIDRISDFYFMEKRLFGALKNDEYLVHVSALLRPFHEKDRRRRGTHQMEKRRPGRGPSLEVHPDAGGHGDDHRCRASGC